GSIAQFVRGMMVEFFSDVKLRDWPGLTLDLLATTGIAVLLVQASNAATLVPNLVIFATLLGHLLLSRNGTENGRLALATPDLRLLFLILILAAGFGQISYGLYAAAFYSGLFLVLERYLEKKSPEKTALEDG
ncbi:MAG: hypothetical protein AB8B54_14770, partial [Sphingorhabdus sp.]